MKTQKFSAKRYVLSGMTAAALLVPMASFTGTAQASMGSHGVRGELPSREAQMLGEKPHAPAPGMFPITTKSHSNPQNPSLTERAINPVLNPNKPSNVN
ncbi:hypothetical protein [Nodosilinea nodulosa]|uniref:hypothetical protein n=1 Tax=Nodosilinea nodulosa TaxID=416001 RepID=UPI0012D72CA3|nr:hypothetical protein [Nodosilinea nodulosa]